MTRASSTIDLLDLLGLAADLAAVALSLLSLGVAVGGVILVLRQIRQAQEQLRLDQRATFVGMLLQLDAAFADLAHHRDWVNKQHKKPVQNQDTLWDIVPYLAVFERVAMAVAEKLLSYERVYQFYSSRLRRLLRTKKARHLLITQPHGWALLIRFIVDLDKYASEAKLNPIVVKHAPPVRESAADRDEEFLAQLRNPS
ncbi:hypothetical protein [Paractinoplanes rishiriensis]|uniref:DUF4760 domain-containing protein n=1 Tax=Paractinoplanes rishiriensis TaxID=1050105 RepID=A0A919MZY8_9ACTN|nr:hypothetical protein [Actinoplanes rishiriensis]GIE94417.1 hypothetical protein Ari01nite_18820 [Actinoplanes rishiriensis]